MWLAEVSAYFSRFLIGAVVILYCHKGLGTLLLVALANASVLDRASLVLVFWSFSLALNLLATACICGRLLFFRYQLRRAFGDECTSQYTNMIALIVESEALYSIYLVIFIVPLVRKDTLIQAFAQAPAAVQVCRVSAQD